VKELNIYLIVSKRIFRSDGYQKILNNRLKKYFKILKRIWNLFFSLSCYFGIYKRYILFKWKGLHANRRYPGVQKRKLAPGVPLHTYAAAAAAYHTIPERIFPNFFFSYLNFPLNCLERRRRRSTRRFLICIFSLNLICTCGLILN